MPDDWHFTHVADDKIDYNFVYENVLKYYEFIYPYMSKHIFSFANPAKVEMFAYLIHDCIDRKIFDKSYYMPPTRELSLGKTILLQRYCKLYANKRGNYNFLAILLF